MRVLTTRRRKALALAVVVALVAATVGVAAWVISGSGSGAAQAGQLQALVVSPNPAGLNSADHAFPGSPGALALNVGNPNGALTIFSVSQNGPATTSSGLCPGTNFSVTARSDLSIPLSASSTTPVKIDGVVVLHPNAPSECQGVASEIPVTLTAQTN